MCLSYPLPSWLDGRLFGWLSGTQRPRRYRKTPNITPSHFHPLQDPAVTAAPPATLGAPGLEMTPEGVPAGPASATTILIPVTQPPVTPTADIASAVCTTATALAVPTAGLASTAVPCAQGAAGVSVWVGWVRASRGGGGVDLHSSAPVKPFLSPGCSCDPRGTSPVRCPPEAEACFCDPVSGQCPCRPHTLGRDCSRCAPLFWNLGGPRGCEPCSCHARHTLQPGCHPVSQPVLCMARSRGRV